MGCIQKAEHGAENSVKDVVHVVEDPSLKNIAKASNVAGNFLSPQAEEVVGDTVATAFGGSALIPLINAGITTTSDIANGQSVGKSLAQGGISGAESLAAQEAAGAVGVGEGNTEFNSALGITGDNPAGTGLPNIGAAASNALGSIGNTLGFTSGGTADAVSGVNSSGQAVDASGQTLSATNSSSPVSVAPSSGGGFTSASSLPDNNSNQINNEFSENLGGSGSQNLTDVAGTSTSASPGLGVGASNAIGAAGPSSATLGATSISPSDLGTNVQTPSTLQSVGSALGLSGGATPSASDVAANNATYAGANAGLPSNITSPGNAGTFFGSTPDAATSGAPAASAGAAAASSPSLLQQAESAGVKAALPLGALAYDAIKGPSKLPAQATNLESGGAATAPLLAMETQAANEAATGQLTSAQQSTIQQGVQQAQNQLLQQLASSGVQNPTQDSRYIAGMQQIQQWAQGQQQAYITQAINEATQAGGAASQNIATVANEQIQEDKDFQDSLAAAFGALGGSLGGNIINSAAKAI